MFHIHIGAHKVGSTSLQRFFALNADLLASLGVTYPEVGRGPFAHHPLAKSLTESKTYDNRDEQIAALSSLAASNPNKTFLLSSEVFEFTRPGGIRALHEAIAPHDARIILYLREFTKLIPSKYAQRTKTGGNHKNFDDFLNIAHEMRWLNISSLTSQWADEFGWDAMCVRVLDRDFLVDGDLLRDAWALLGLSPEAFDRCDPASLEPINTSPGWVTLEAVREVNCGLLDAGIELSEDQPTKGVKRRSAKTGLHASVEALRIGKLAKVCEDAAAELGLADQAGHYLNREQWTTLNGLYRREIEWLNARLPGSPLPLPKATAPEDRPFLPQFSALPPEQRARFGRQVMRSRTVRRLPAPVMAAISAALVGRATPRGAVTVSAWRHRIAGRLMDVFLPASKGRKRKKGRAGVRQIKDGDAAAAPARRPTLMRRAQRKIARWGRRLRGTRRAKDPNA